jgi:hypothetical protein
VGPHRRVLAPGATTAVTVPVEMSAMATLLTLPPETRVVSLAPPRTCWFYESSARPFAAGTEHFLEIVLMAPATAATPARALAAHERRPESTCRRTRRVPAETLASATVASTCAA